MREICDAIAMRRRLEFRYDGSVRVVEPYCHGIGGTGAMLLRAVQVRGHSSAGARGFGFGKLWRVDKIDALRVLDETFEPSDPNYNPADRALVEIHCRI